MTLSIGTAVAGKVCSEMAVPVTAQVTDYRSATSAKVAVTVSPVDDGAAGVRALSGWTKEFEIGGDTAVHQFAAAFDGLTAGVTPNRGGASGFARVRVP